MQERRKWNERSLIQSAKCWQHRVRLDKVTLVQRVFQCHSSRRCSHVCVCVSVEVG